MVDWWGSKNVTGQTSPAAAAALPLMEEKKAKEDQGVRDAGHLLPGTSMNPKRDGDSEGVAEG